jgi:hypothetical protein
MFGSTPSFKPEWTLPEKPINKDYKIKFESKDGGLWLDETSSKNLLKYFDDIDTYNLKMENLVKEIKKYHGDK